MKRTVWWWSLIGIGLWLNAGAVEAQENAPAVAPAATHDKATNTTSTSGTTTASQVRSLQQTIDLEIRLKQWDEAEAKLKELDVLLPASQKDFVDAVRFSILVGKGNMAVANQFAVRMSEVHSNNAPLLNDLAWRIATDIRIRQRDLVLANKLATRAYEVSHGVNVGILDTLARVRFMLGNSKEAISLAERAVELCEPGQKKMMESVLDNYRHGELPRVE